MKLSFKQKKKSIKARRIKFKNLRMYRKGRRPPRHTSFRELTFFTKGLIKRDLTINVDDYRTKEPKKQRA